MRLLPILLVALAAGCTHRDGDVSSDAAPVSRDANGDCVRAWNAAGNVANRSAAAAEHSGWSVGVSEWSVSHPNPEPAGSDLIGEGCSYFFDSAMKWRSYSGGWEADGDLRWDVPPSMGGERTPAQQIELPNAILRENGRLARLAQDDGRPVRGRESRAVIDDWYDNGVFDRAHRCGAVRAAILRLPRDRPYSSVLDDFRRYAEQIC